MRNNKLYILLSVVILIIAVSLFVFFRNKNDFLGKTDKDGNSETISKVVLPGDDEKIFSSLNGESIPSVAVFPDIPAKRVKELLSAVKTPESFCWYYTHTLNSSRISQKEFGIARFDVDTYKIEVYDNSSQLKKTVLEDNGTVVINTDGNSKEFVSFFTDPFKEAGVPSLSDFLKTDTLNMTYSLVESEYGSLIYAQFVSTKGPYMQTEQYYISLDYGIVVRADCYENGILVYHLETNALYEVESTALQQQ